MTVIKCSRCGNEKEGMSEAPYKNELGQKVLQHTCEECWEAWIKQQLMLMNEYRLDPLNDEHSQFLDTEMLKFLNLT
ncbi:MAG: oxidative damage protection protein [bacterium]